jgi:hypothetical protein
LHTAPSHIKNITVLPQQYQHIRNHIQQNHGGQVKLKIKPGASPGGEGQAGPGASPGGEGQAAAKPGEVDQLEASQHQQPAIAAVHSTTFAQLQAKVETLQEYHC